MKKLLFFLLAMVLCNLLLAQGRHVFSLGKDEFLLDGRPLQLICGEMHPARIPKEYWRQRVQMAKAMGCNSIAVYIFWNYHESKPGVFDFKSGNRDIAEFIRICQQEGMWVLFRPGPYVCAEWDFGGLPPYLLKIPDIRIRCMDKRYMAATERYISRLAKEMKALQCTNGGPILMVQIENEYGSFGNDRQYLDSLRTLWVKNGINVPFYTADGPTAFMLEAGNIDGAAIGLDSGGSEADFEQAKKRNPNVPAFSSETYPGWLTHWGEKWARPDTNNLKKEVEFLLKTKRSLNFYVIHGGTNFGFTAGANAFTPTQYQPDLTSYDYDAPINEQGQPTAKFFMLRNLIEKYVTYKIPDIPVTPATINIPPVLLKYAGNLFDHLSKPFLSPQTRTMEELDQDHGLILYRTKLIGHKSGKLKIWEPHDYALVFIDGKFIDTVFRDGGEWTVEIPKTSSAYPVLDILVEAMGRINFAQFMIDRKGITDRVTLNGMTLMNWEIFSFPMEGNFVNRVIQSPKTRTRERCNFFSGRFILDKTGDTYFDLSGYTKGIVYVNGHNLGRYWHIGPQKRLFCPAGWLKTGENEIVVFDLLQEKEVSISGQISLE